MCGELSVGVVLALTVPFLCMLVSLGHQVECLAPCLSCATGRSRAVALWQASGGGDGSLARGKYRADVCQQVPAGCPPGHQHCGENAHGSGSSGRILPLFVSARCPLSPTDHWGLGGQMAASSLVSQKSSCGSLVRGMPSTDHDSAFLTPSFEMGVQLTAWFSITCRGRGLLCV